MELYDIAKEHFAELDKKSLLNCFTDYIPHFGYSLQLKRIKKRREKILNKLNGKIKDPEKLDEINQLMVEHNQDKLIDSEMYHYLSKRVAVATGLFGAGIVIGKYLCN